MRWIAAIALLALGACTGGSNKASDASATPSADAASNTAEQSTSRSTTPTLGPSLGDLRLAVALLTSTGDLECVPEPNEPNALACGNAEQSVIVGLTGDSGDRLTLFEAYFTSSATWSAEERGDANLVLGLLDSLSSGSLAIVEPYLADDASALPESVTETVGGTHVRLIVTDETVGVRVQP